MTQILKRLGLCISFATINNNHYLHGAMDNFDHDRITPQGIGRSNDSILMVFQINQNLSNGESKEYLKISKNSPFKQMNYTLNLTMSKID